jgi:hypothetical protein
MKFIVREGFVIHDTKRVEVQGQLQDQTNSYYEGQTVDFDEKTATDHAHKLEPADKASTAFFDKNYPVLAVAQVSSGGGDASAQIQALAKQVSDLTTLVATMAGAVHQAVNPGAAS